MKAYDLSRYQRLIGVEGGRVTGKFEVVGGLRKREELWITTVDVVVWHDDEHHSGIVFYSNDFTTSVKDGEVGKPVARGENKQAVVESHWDDFVAALLAVADEFERVTASLLEDA